VASQEGLSSMELVIIFVVYMGVKLGCWEEYKLRGLRRIFWCKRDEVPGGWDKVCNELLNLYLSHYIIIMIKS
jgi:hypothetical protein